MKKILGLIILSILLLTILCSSASAVLVDSQVYAYIMNRVDKVSVYSPSGSFMGRYSLSIWNASSPNYEASSHFKTIAGQRYKFYVYHHGDITSTGRVLRAHGPYYGYFRRISTATNYRWYAPDIYCINNP